MTCARKWLVSICVSAALSGSLMAQSPFFQTYHLLRKSEVVQVNRILQDAKGYMWFATNKGVFRSDGTSHDLIEGTTSEPVTTLAEDSTGAIWFGTRSGKMGSVNTDLTVIWFDPPEGSATAAISDILFDRAGNLWFSTFNDGLYYFTKERLYRLDDADGLPDIFLYDIEEDPDGNIWAGSDGGVVICKLIDRKVEVQVLDYSNGLPDNIIRNIKTDGNSMLLATQDAGIVSFDRTTRKVTRVLDEAWDFGEVNDMVVDVGQLWAASSSGILSFDRKSRKIMVYSGAEGTQSPAAIHKDAEGNIWAGSRSGLVRCFNSYLRYVGIGERGNVLAVAVDRSGGIWYSSDDGLYHRRLDSRGRATTTRKLAGTSYANRKIISLFVDESGGIWCGFYGEGAIRLDPNTNKIEDISKRLRNGNVLSIKGRGNQIWMATLNGAARVSMNGNKVAVESIGETEGLSTDYIYQVFPDSKGRVWFASDREGVSMYDDKGFHQYPKAFGARAVYGFVEDANGNIWANVALDGLYYFDGNEFRKRPSESNVNCLALSHTGKLVIVHDQGIDIQIPGDSVMRRFGDEVGFAGRQANLNAIASGPDGEIYIGTDDGIVVFTEPTDVLSSPVPLINEFRAFNVAKPLDANLQLSYDENNVTIGFAGFWYQNPEGLGFQYRLDGYDLDWINSSDRMAIYSSLPPGEYTFRVRVSDSGNFARAEDVSMSFVVSPPFWRTAPFYALASVLIAAAGYMFIRWRERRLLKDKLELEQRVRERTFEIQRKNEEIQAQAEEIKVINENLERRVLERTHELERKNKALEEYAFINAHKLRSPVASVLGLINLLDKTDIHPNEKELVDHMKTSAERLDSVVRAITESIEKGAEFPFDTEGQEEGEE